MILVISSKNSYATERLVEEARDKRLEVRVMDLKDLIAADFKVDPSGFDVLYIRNPYLNGSPKYLPKIIKLAKQFRAAGKKVVDANIAKGFLGQGKWEDYKILKKYKLPIPKTALLSSKTIPKKFPFIVKWMFGFKGKNVFLINSQQEFGKAFKKYSQDELMVQEFVSAEYEYKVVTVGYKALPVVLRFNINPKNYRPDFIKYKVITWRHSEPQTGKRQGGEESHPRTEILGLHSDVSQRLIRLRRTLAQDDAIAHVVKLAEKAAKVLGRELSKIDILEKDGKFYILEVNRFPGLDSFEKLTNFNVAGEFIRVLQSKWTRF
jgi:glutathione synthase/RimK-type ligase-like ATP-grasp enzyme